jgi:hypothetical protein
VRGIHGWYTCTRIHIRINTRTKLRAECTERGASERALSRIGGVHAQYGLAKVFQDEKDTSLIPSLSHTHTHTHSLSLSISLSHPKNKQTKTRTKKHHSQPLSEHHGNVTDNLGMQGNTQEQQRNTHKRERHAQNYIQNGEVTLEKKKKKHSHSGW